MKTSFVIVQIDRFKENRKHKCFVKNEIEGYIGILKQHSQTRDMRCAMAQTYKDAGVNIDLAAELVNKIKARVAKTCGPRVVSGVGGFASLYDVDGERLLAAGTDGVGTKLLVAQKLGIHNTIGIDLVAMCINDILCTGAQGLFFMDYLATGTLDVSIAEQIMSGIIEGCTQANVALVGGETAEMPGMYSEGKYDLAGFAVGEVLKKDVLDGSTIKAGDSIVGIASSGIHANGLSLARLLSVDDHDHDGDGHADDAYWHELLRPTKIYTPEMKALQASESRVHGLAHITGGGLLNIARLNHQYDYSVDAFPLFDDVAPIFKELAQRSQLSKHELFKTFNMGVGMCVITPDAKGVRAVLEELGVQSWTIGRVIKGSGNVLLNGERLA